MHKKSNCGSPQEEEIMTAIESTLTKKELGDLCEKIINYINSFELNAASKYLVVHELYYSFIEVCKKEGLKLRFMEEMK